MESVKIIGLTGGTGVGKTEYSMKFKQILGDQGEVLSVDGYYDIGKIDETAGYSEFDDYHKIDYVSMIKDIQAIQQRSEEATVQDVVGFLPHTNKRRKV